MRYEISYTELVYKTCIVEADSPEEAEERLKAGEYEYIDDVQETSSDVEEVNEINEIDE